MLVAPLPTHPEGEQKPLQECMNSILLETDTYTGKVFVDFDPNAPMTALGQLPFFVQFLKTGGLFHPWVEECPLHYTSPNAPEKINVLGSLFLSILSGHKRYAHVGILQNDPVAPKLLGMTKLVSADSARRGFKKIDLCEGTTWFQKHLRRTYLPFLKESWILDVDVTIKTLYGKQEGAEVGYNPKKPGRPTHTYHSYMVANIRLLLDVEVQGGKNNPVTHSAPGLLDILKSLPEDCRPELVRGDCDWGCDAVMRDLESLDQAYLFKLKKTSKVKELIHRHHCLGDWTVVKKGWEAVKSEVQLTTWDKPRRVLIVRRRFTREDPLLLESTKKGQQRLAFVDEVEDITLYEYSILVTNSDEDEYGLFQLYRDRADCENIFDEIKNHWGWGGFTTQDQKSCILMARMVALIYNWWTLFVRLLNPAGKHLEAITSKPLLLTSIGRLTESGRQKKISISHHHAAGNKVQRLFSKVSDFLRGLNRGARQLTPAEKWVRIAEAIICQYYSQTGASAASRVNIEARF